MTERREKVHYYIAHPIGRAEVRHVAAGEEPETQNQEVYLTKHWCWKSDWDKRHERRNTSN